MLFLVIFHIFFKLPLSLGGYALRTSWNKPGRVFEVIRRRSVDRQRCRIWLAGLSRGLTNSCGNSCNLSQAGVLPDGYLLVQSHRLMRSRWPMFMLLEISHACGLQLRAFKRVARVVTFPQCFWPLVGCHHQRQCEDLLQKLRRRK